MNLTQDTTRKKPARGKIQHIFREIIGILAAGSLIGTVMGQCVIGMLDNQRLAAQRMRQAASVAGVDHVK